MSKELGHRRVQRTGRGSFTISLPKDWAKETGIERGTEIAFKVQDDSLILIPREIERKKNNKPEYKECIIHVDPKDDLDSLCRKIIALYVVSTDIIRVRFKDSKDIRQFVVAINNLVKNVLLGAEIIEETTSEISIQILVDHLNFSVEKAIRRMAVLALSTNSIAVTSLKSMEKNVIQGIIDAYNDVNRLNLYVTRQLKYGLERNLCKELGFRTPKEFLGYRIVANEIKSIADSAMSIARNVTTLKKMIDDQMLFIKQSIDEEVYSQILDLNQSVHQLFEESVKALFKRDYDHADALISRTRSYMLKENDLIAIMSSKKLDPNISSIFSLILDNSRRIVECSQNIAEVTLNRTIEEVYT